MPRNIEIKSRVRDFEKTSSLAARLSGSPPKILIQEDIFFTAPRGRVKLRIQNGSAELIYYLRENAPDPRPSDYLCLPVPDAAAARQILSEIHGRRGTVRKTRHLYLVGQTRIHLDQVEGLGNFLELEVVLRDNQTNEEGTAIANNLMKKLEITAEDLLDRAYIDMQSEE
jgi:predicted adenylyl cyclase CyaB